MSSIHHFQVVSHSKGWLLCMGYCSATTCCVLLPTPAFPFPLSVPVSALTCSADGRFLLGSSALMGSMWDGGLSVFSGLPDFHQCPNLTMVTCNTPSGVNDAVWYVCGLCICVCSVLYMYVHVCLPLSFSPSLPHSLPLSSLSPSLPPSLPPSLSPLTLVSSRLPGEQSVLAGCDNGCVEVYRTQGPVLCATEVTVQVHDDMVLGVALLAGEERAVTVGQDSK